MFKRSFEGGLECFRALQFFFYSLSLCAPPFLRMRITHLHTTFPRLDSLHQTLYSLPIQCKHKNVVFLRILPAFIPG